MSKVERINLFSYHMLKRIRVFCTTDLMLYLISMQRKIIFAERVHIQRSQKRGQ